MDAREKIMKVMSIEEAMEKGLLYESPKGLAIKDMHHTIESKSMQSLHAQIDQLDEKRAKILDRIDEIEKGKNIEGLKNGEIEQEINRLKGIKETYRDQKTEIIRQLEEQDELSKLEQGLVGEKTSVNIPSILVSDDERRVFCVEHKREYINRDGNTATRDYKFVRTYTPDNVPICVGGRYENEIALAVQNNKNSDIEKKEYHFHIKTAKGAMLEKARINQTTRNIEEVIDLKDPILVSYQEGVLKVEGSVQLEEAEELPLIDEGIFIDYNYCIEMNGKEYDTTYGYQEKISKQSFTEGIIRNVKKLSITKGIDPKVIECIGYDSTTKQEFSKVFEDGEIEILDPKEEELRRLMSEDQELDEKIQEGQKVLEILQEKDKKKAEETPEK